MSQHRHDGQKPGPNRQGLLFFASQKLPVAGIFTVGYDHGRFDFILAELLRSLNYCAHDAQFSGHTIPVKIRSHGDGEGLIQLACFSGGDLQWSVYFTALSLPYIP
jgi:hypothetical protein